MTKYIYPIKHNISTSENSISNLKIMSFSRREGFSWEAGLNGEIGTRKGNK